MTTEDFVDFQDSLFEEHTKQYKEYKELEKKYKVLLSKYVELLKKYNELKEEFPLTIHPLNIYAPLNTHAEF